MRVGMWRLGVDRRLGRTFSRYLCCRVLLVFESKAYLIRAVLRIWMVSVLY